METFLRCSVREFGVVKEVPRPSWQTIPLDAKGFIEFRPLWYFGLPALQPSVELAIANVQSSYWDIVELS